MDVAATRKAMKLSRKQLAEKAGVTESAVWSVEHGKNPHGGEETRQKVLAALDPASEQVDTPLDTPPTPEAKKVGVPSGHRGGKRLAPPKPRPDWTYRYEWEGLTSGDPCRISGETGTARFQEHVVTEMGNTHVTVLLDGSWRSFAPDRVHRAEKRKRRGPGDGTNGATDWKIEVLTVAGETHTLTFATYADARTQAKIEAQHDGKVKIFNYHGTCVEVQPYGWCDDAVTVPKPVTV